MNVTRSIASNNTGHGFLANGGTLGIMVVGDSMSTSNGGSGFASVTGGTLGSRGNNTVIFNTGSAILGLTSPVTGL